MSSRKEQKEALRRERLERERQAAEADRRKRLIGYGAAGALALAAVIALAVVLLAGGGDGDGGGGGKGGDFPEGSVPAAKVTELEAAVKAAGCKLGSAKSEGQSHVSGKVQYKANPPHSGNHNQIPAEDEAYTDAPEIENLVHSLEHGRILIWFKPTVSNETKGDLKALFDDDPYHMLLTPNEANMPFEVAATAWTKSLTCPKMNDKVFDAIRAFRDRFRDKGPEFVP